MSNPEFVHLHVHTAFSLLDGAIRVKDLLAQVQAYGMPAVAITDHGSMFGVLDFYQKARAAGIKPLLGCELYVAPGSRQEKTGKGENRHLVVLGDPGSGKTTLFNLLVRFHDTGEGHILVDDTDIRDLTRESLRAQFALVSQDIFLFNDTVAANIAYGTPTASDVEIRHAATAAHATNFIESLPNGFATEIGDKGIRLSGGQRQRLAIARAVLKKAPILLLDEATSALDSESEQHVQSAIEELTGTATTIVIAHRLSTVRRANRILVMAQGRIVEQGSHEELLARSGEYKKLYDIQFRDEADMQARQS